jgi:hypothetical protein
MAEGFVVDATHGGAAVSGWVEGAPEKSVWTGLKLSGKARSEIATWRCNRCGFLEHYAAEAPDRRQETAQRTQALMVVAISLAIVLLVLGAVLILR